MTVQTDANEDANGGALFCSSCCVYHTRAAEAVFPMALLYQETGEKRYLAAAVQLGNWLIRQQLADGAWKETPEEWTGTTTDQLLMMVLAFQIIKKELTAEEQIWWQTSICRAADYLTEVMSPEFASINYCATTTASLALTFHYFPDEKYLDKARWLARQIMSKMDKDGFICAEGDRAYNAKYGADIGYEIDMSLWGLALYARTTGDTLMQRLVSESLLNHLYFVYPNGAIDGSWGIRSNKWTTYGSMTADGCQILFSLFAAQDGRYRTAAWRNLQYLRDNMKDGFVGYGPQYWQLFKHEPCIYPTFCRAKNLALAAQMSDPAAGSCPDLPCDETGWLRYFPTVEVALVRTNSMMATISAYQYKELQKRSRSKYMHRPCGGSICNLWVQDHGFLQTSSQTEYHRWEPMHFPEASGLLPLTSRIEFSNEHGYFTNLYEFDGKLTCEKEAQMSVSVSGELCDRNLLPGGVAYQWSYRFSEASVEKRVELRFHDGHRDVSIIEPVVMWPDMEFFKQDARTVLIKGTKKSFLFKVVQGDVDLALGEQKEKYYSPFPAMRAFPIVLKVRKPDSVFKTSVSYRIDVIDRF